MLTNFDFPSAVRIARVVRAVEEPLQRARPLTFEPVLQERQQQRAIRLCTFTGSWSKDSNKTLTFSGETTTVLATNLLLDIPEPCAGNALRDVLIAKNGTAWVYVAHESPCANATPARELGNNASCQSRLDDVADATSQNPQVLMNEEGCSKWMGLHRRDVVVDVRFEDGKIVVEKREMFVVLDNSEEVTYDVATCDQLSANITGGTVTVAGGLGSGTVTINGDCESGRQVNIDISLNTDSCPTP